jgi:peptide deformylase
MIKAVQVGSPIIRKKLKLVSKADLGSKELMDCLSAMRSVNDGMQGVGISANQVGYDMRVSLIHVKPTKFRPDSVGSSEKIMINPVIEDLIGKSEYMWEGCLSVAEAGIFCKVNRYKHARVKYMSLNGVLITEELTGFTAHIAQHEIAHLDGQIFLDVEHDKSTYMSASEYIAMRKSMKDKKNG